MILGTVCMRGESKGVKGKNYKELLGKPLMNYTLECAMLSNVLDDVVVSSDSDFILSMASTHVGTEKLFKRSIELATDRASKWDVFRDLVTKYEEKNNLVITHIVDLDVTVPRRLVSHIHDCVKFALESNVDVVITGYEPERNPYFNMMEENESGIAVMSKKLETPVVCRQDAPKVYSLSPSIYVIKRDSLFKFDHWSNAACKIFPIPRELALDIDTDFDFQLVEYLMRTANG